MSSREGETRFDAGMPEPGRAEGSAPRVEPIGEEHGSDQRAGDEIRTRDVNLGNMTAKIIIIDKSLESLMLSVSSWP